MALSYYDSGFIVTLEETLVRCFSPWLRLYHSHYLSVVSRAATRLLLGFLFHEGLSPELMLG